MAALKQVRRLVVLIVGGAVLLVGIALLVLPGPAFVVIPIGLAILSTEFLWPRRWLRKLRGGAGAVGRSLRRSRG
jgi:tellurite resistance protein TerC